MNIKEKSYYINLLIYSVLVHSLWTKNLLPFLKIWLNKILSISDADFNISNSRLSALNREEYCLIAEYFEKGTIEIVDACIARLPLWLWLIVKPIYLDIEALRKDITNNKIKNKRGFMPFLCLKGFRKQIW